MADHEVRLVNVAWKGDGSGWKRLVAAKLTPEMFFNEDVRQVFQFALDIQQKHGSFPSEVFTKQNFPNFRRLKVTDSLDLLIDAFKEWRQAQVVREFLTTATDAYANGDVATALASMEAGIAQVALESLDEAGDIELTDHATERYEAYQEFANRPEGLLGVPTGFPQLDELLSGLQPRQLITVVALPKVGKSTLAMAMGIAAHDAGSRIMLQTIEMSAEEMRQRYDAMRAKVSFQRFRTGTLKPSEEKRFVQMLERTEAMTNPFHITESVTNLPQIAAKIEEHRPQIVIVDGIYLLDSHPDFAPGSPQALTYLSRAFKQLAKSTNTTIIMTTQALEQKTRQGKLSAHSIGYSSAFLQDSDLVLGLEVPKEENGDVEDARNLVVLASRSTGGLTIELDWDWETGTFAEVGA